MAISSSPNTDSGRQTLLLDTVGTVLEVAKIARLNEANPKVKVFYSHLTYHCLRLQEALTRARQDASCLNNDCLDRAISHFGVLIPESGLDEFPAFSVTLEFRLKMLSLWWNETCRRTDDAKLDFVSRWLRQDITEEERLEVDEALETCADDLDKQLPEISVQKRSNDFPTLHDGEPPFAVWKVAKSIFDALLECKSCSCPSEHEFKAKLELGTYRSREKKPVLKPSRRPNRKHDGDSDMGGFEMDMFLCMEHDWHEFRIQAAKETIVRFSGHEEASSCPERKTRSSKRIERLCKPIIEIRTRPLQRLLVRLKSGHLFEVRPEKSNFQIDKTTEPISLSGCFDERKDFFTEKTKRILSLIIGYTVLHLYGTSWLQPGWGSSNIKFFQTTACKTPLRPFVEAQLRKTDDPGDYEDEWTEEFDSGHSCPEMVALAVVLMEIYFVKPFRQLAEMHNIPLIDTRSGRITLMDVDQVFWGDEEGEEGWRTQIPEDSPLLEAIDNCLDGEIWEDNEGDRLDVEELRTRIYEKVVRPLELHLRHGFSQIQLDGVDQYAKSLDFGKWSQVITTKETDQLLPLSAGQTTSRVPSPALLLAQGQFDINAMFSRSFQQVSHLQAQVPSSLSHLGYALSDDNLSEMSQFFDDHVNDGDKSVAEAETEKYRTWRSEYEDVYKTFVGDYIDQKSTQPVKIAILDTGIDRDHPFLELYEDNMKGKKNFHNASQKNVPDTNGHGTFAANLILDYARDAHLYIIKIADKKNATPDAAIVANAIYHAVDKWAVDIISMSFGWPSSDMVGHDALEDAIDHAYSKKVLMFAAASNSGARLGRAYPASNPHVICVHSTDTNGEASGFSPTAEPNSINLATVGESVESAWPTLLSRDSRCLQSRSGTSYATRSWWVLQHSSYNMQASIFLRSRHWL
ncbi:hypothetical protein FOMA001_g14601 [Fusarium oxysporum f. sp. matthiolae]|nr:hypothetical protein FOMA001_g14601 [Fusarium oxysporum f. sp. matthiolae]